MEKFLFHVVLSYLARAWIICTPYGRRCVKSSSNRQEDERMQVDENHEEFFRLYCDMNQEGPIIIIEDDQDDQQMLREIFAELGVGNELVLLTTGKEALDYLENPNVRPFVVISDINIPKMSGLQVRAAIDQHKEDRIRCVPYVFLTTAASHNTICDAYALSVQGFFVKPNTFEEMKDTIKCILLYWQRGKTPNKD